MFNKYKSYLEAWLNIPIGEIKQANGIILTSCEKRNVKPSGWQLVLPVCALETNNAVIISYAPKFADELHNLLRSASVSDAIPRMIKYFKDEKNLATAYHKNYGLEALNSKIDISDALMLNDSHYEQYVSYYKQTYPALYAHMKSERKWLPQHFKEQVKRKTNFCLLHNNKIVSSTESESIPNKPGGIIDIGINTLKEYRRKGYASIVCAGFIKYNCQKNILPLWSCAIDNNASEKLALKLGFRHIGNVFSVNMFEHMFERMFITENLY